MACEIADVIEQADAESYPVHDAGGSKRAKAAALLIASVRESAAVAAPLRKAGMPVGLEGEWIAMVMRETVARWQLDGKLAQIVSDLRRWPDGLYPSQDAPGIEGRKACRVEEAARLLRQRGVILSLALAGRANGAGLHHA